MRQYRYHHRTVITWRVLHTLFTLALVTGLAQCSRADNATPVAAVAVSPTKPQVTSEGLLELHYKFDVLPGATVPADQKVFVHLVTADGTRVWGDDHLPPVPTGQWASGRTIEYSRTAFLPALGVPAGADLTVLVGLYREAARVPLQGTSPAEDRAYAVAHVQLAPEADRVFLIYTGGWHPDEFSSDGGISGKWTQKAATVSFKNPKRDVTLVIEFDARPDVFAGVPQQVTVSTPVQRLSEITASASDTPTLVRIPVPAAALGSAEMSEIRLEVDKAFVPAELAAGGRDTRQLGVRVYHLLVDGR
jgi:hypothetical protein